MVPDVKIVSRDQSPYISYSTICENLFRVYMFYAGLAVRLSHQSTILRSTGPLLHSSTFLQISLFHCSTGPPVHWSTGPLVHWSTGPVVYCFTGALVYCSTVPPFCHSTVPLLHCSSGPLVHSSTIPLFHCSIGPLYHCSTIPLIVHFH